MTTTELEFEVNKLRNEREMWKRRFMDCDTDRRKLRNKLAQRDRYAELLRRHRKVLKNSHDLIQQIVDLANTNEGARKIWVAVGDNLNRIAAEIDAALAGKEEGK